MPAVESATGPNGATDVPATVGVCLEPGGRRKTIKTGEDKGLITGKVLGSLPHCHLYLLLSNFTEAFSLDTDICPHFPMPELEDWFPDPWFDLATIGNLIPHFPCCIWIL